MIFNGETVIEHSECCGCGACVNICPYAAIEMVENSEGFLYPEINQKKCVNCGLCKKVCPILNKINDNFKTPDCYAAMANDDIRKVSSSGGAFSIIAEYILDKNGYVCGCSFDLDELNAKHIIINSKDDLSKLRGSKYLQSDIGNIYQEVKKILDDDKYLLFSGTPCQIAGLKSFLRKNYEKLLTIDILCHGVPSPKVYKKYLNETISTENEKLISINFRDKKDGWSPILTNTTITNTTTYSYKQIKDTYMQLFLSNICLRQNCTDCKYCNTQREGDFTIADFWGINNYDKKLNDNKGTSLILLNNKKAKSIYSEIEKCFELSKKVPLKYAILGNRNLYAPHKMHPKRDEFFENLNKYTLKQLTNMYLYDKYDCGIMNYWASWNYGAILTCFALQELVKSFGFTTQIVNFRPKVWDNRKEYPRNDSKIDFVNKYFNLSVVCKNKQELTKLNDNFNTFIVGSDQVWNWGYNLKYLYFLDFVKNSKKKISCAASMIFEKFNHGEDVKTTIEYHLKRFDAISVREWDNVSVCKNEFDVDATCILDPVFLIDKSIYNNLIQNSKLKLNKKFIAVYLFEYGNDIAKFVNKIATDNNYDIVIMNRGESIEDWLYYIKNAELIITDSYHGTCFSLIFEKQFISFCNSRGNSRFHSLFSILNIKNRLFSNLSNIEDIFAAINTEVDYNSVNNLLDKEASKSLKWLSDALITEKNKFKQTVESRLLNILIERKQMQCGIKPYLIKLKNKNLKIQKSFFKKIKKIKTKLFMLSENTFFLK